MLWQSITALVLVLLCSLGCSEQPAARARASDQVNSQSQATNAEGKEADAPDGAKVASMPSLDFTPSLVALLANPQHYHGRKIRVEGFMHVEFEGNAIYLSKDDADHLITSNGLWVSFDKNAIPYEGVVGPKEFHRKWVLIEGVFKYNPQGSGHFGGWSGEIKSIDRIYELKRHYSD